MAHGANFSRVDNPIGMRERRLSVIGLLFLSLWFAIPAFSQNSTEIDTTLSGIKSLFDGGSYISAELQARRILEDRNISDSMRIQFEKYVAFSLVAQGRNDAAVDHFKNALEIDSTFSLDPVLTSPKILEVFDAAKGQFSGELERKRSKADASLEGSTSRREGGGPTFRAILFPGWGTKLPG